MATGILFTPREFVQSIFEIDQLLTEKICECHQCIFTISFAFERVCKNDIIIMFEKYLCIAQNVPMRNL